MLSSTQRRQKVIEEGFIWAKTNIFIYIYVYYIDLCAMGKRDKQLQVMQDNLLFTVKSKMREKNVYVQKTLRSIIFLCKYLLECKL